MEKERRDRLNERQRRYLRWGFWLLVILLLYVSLNWLIGEALRLLQANPDVWALYKGVEYEVAARSLRGFFLAMVVGALFFVAIPVEAVFLLFLGLDYPPAVIIAIGVAGAVLGNLLNYAIGAAIGPKPVQWIIKEQYATFRRKVDRAGAFLVFVGNIVPFPNDLLALFLGTVRYNVLKFVLYNALAKALQFTLFYLAYRYVFLRAAPYLGIFSYDWLVQLIRSSFGG